jgi:hypothetical protein
MQGGAAVDARRVLALAASPKWRLHCRGGGMRSRLTMTDWPELLWASPWGALDRPSAWRHIDDARRVRAERTQSVGTASSADRTVDVQPASSIE